ncbi:hypothetical protein ACXR0O_14250 [Verrucomicrobiota bacterium sgz303538]
MKRNKLLVCAVFLAIVLLSVAAYLSIQVEINRRVIDRYSSKNEQGMQCFWRVGTQQEVRRTPSWWETIQGARPVHIHVEWPAFESDHKGAQEFAAAIRFFGSLEKFVVGYSCQEFMTLISGFGRQPNLTNLFCFNAPVTDEISRVLPLFPRLRNFAFVPSTFTGEGAPVMPELETVDLSWSPITAKGFQRIAASPKLVGIKITQHPNPSPALHKVIYEIQAARPDLDVTRDAQDR